MDNNNYAASSSSSSSLAPGFRFHPTDEELVFYYLKRKVCGKPFRVDAISDIDIYKFEPWDLPDRSKLKSRDLEWYFFSGLDKKYGNGWRTNRATEAGYWKTTGKDRSVRRGERIVGMKKTLVFHAGRAPHGERTNWVMHEYRLVDEALSQAGIAQDAFVLCRIFRKSGPGPKNGEKYGAPLIEEEWDDVDDVLDIGNEYGNAGFCEVADNGYVQPKEECKDHVLASIPQNDPLVRTECGDGSNHLENLGDCYGDVQKVFIGTGESVGWLESSNEQMFLSPEQFQMDHTPNENEYFNLDDFLNPLDNSNQAEGTVGGELTCLNASQVPSVVNGTFLSVDDLNSCEADQNPFESFDECFNFFDTIDDSSFVDTTSEVTGVGIPYMNQSVYAEELVNAQNEQTHLALPESPETTGYEGASTSEKEAEMSKLAGDVKYNTGWDSTLAKQVSRMLGSIPAPTAYAAEVSTKEAAFAQNPAAQASTSVHVTAGMIHISGMTVIDAGKFWSVGKSGNASLLLPYGMALGDVNLIGNSFEPMGNTHTLSSKATSVILRSGFYFMFLWVIALSVSCKIGSYIYIR